jgi:hypothetical protein
MKRFVKFLILFLLIAPLTISAETITLVPSPTWQDGTAVSATDAAKFTFYLRIWRGTDPKAVPASPFYFGETRNGETTWGVAGDNTYIMTQANKYITPVLVPGDNVIISVSAAFNDGTQELDSWTTFNPGLAQAYRIPGGVVIPVPAVTLTAAPASVVKGSCSTLSWSSTNATVASLDQGIGSVATTGTQSVCPTATTTYTLMAMGAGGTTIKTATVTVTTPPAQPGCNAPASMTIKP